MIATWGSVQANDIGEGIVQTMHGDVSLDGSRAVSGTVGLEARGWPLGKAHVTIEVEPLDEHTSRVTMVEDAVAGPGMIVPSQARQLLIVPRNRESLQRLSQIVEGRWRESRRADSTSSASPL